jgi:hypothetical protein
LGGRLVWVCVGLVGCGPPPPPREWLGELEGLGISPFPPSRIEGLLVLPRGVGQPRYRKQHPRRLLDFNQP